MSHDRKYEKHHGHHHHHHHDFDWDQDSYHESCKDDGGCCESSHSYQHKHGAGTCSSGPKAIRHFVSPAEYKERLEKYIEELRSELEGAEAAFAKL